MPLENIPYKNMPLHITVSDVDSYPLHYHKDVEIVYVLEGRLHLTNGSNHYALNAGDIFTTSGHEVHSLSGEGDHNITAIIHFSNLYFSQFFQDLPRGCYRTYSIQGMNPWIDELRMVLLRLLIAYFEKEMDYPDRCSNLCTELIQLLEDHFNLFRLKDGMIVSFDHDNPIVADRLTRIIRYLYENYASNITLKDLANMEHLSSYYMSHLIKEYVHLSFRDFLSFARVEWSIIQLLDTDMKINQIARAVGFSTSRYYEEAFYRWFGETPAEYRTHWRGHALNKENRPRILPLTSQRTLSVVRQIMRQLTAQNPSLTSASHEQKIIQISQSTPMLSRRRVHLELTITLEDVEVMGSYLYEYLQELAPKQLILLVDEQDSKAMISRIREHLAAKGFSITVEQKPTLPTQGLYGYDLLVAPILLNQTINDSLGSPIRIPLRDQGNPHQIIKGDRGLIASHHTPKPYYYICKMLVRSNGIVLSEGKHHTILRLSGTSEAYLLIVYNYNQATMQLCERSTGVYNAREIADTFQDAFDLTVSLNLPRGDYFITRYNYNINSSLFSVMANLNFPENFTPDYPIDLHLISAPFIDASSVSVSDEISLDFFLRGTGVQMMLVQPIPE